MRCTALYLCLCLRLTTLNPGSSEKVFSSKAVSVSYHAVSPMMRRLTISFILSQKHRVLLFPCISTNLNPQPPQRRGRVPIRCSVAGLRRSPIPSSESEIAPPTSVIMAAQDSIQHILPRSTALFSEPIHNQGSRPAATSYIHPANHHPGPL